MHKKPGHVPGFFCSVYPALGDCASNALRLRYAVALGIVDTHAAQHRNNLFVLGELGDRAFTGQVPDLVNGSNHFAIDRIMQDLFDETAVDLKEIYREVLQVAE